MPYERKVLCSRTEHIDWQDLEPHSFKLNFSALAIMPSNCSTKIVVMLFRRIWFWINE